MMRRVFLVKAAVAALVTLALLHLVDKIAAGMTAAQAGLLP